MENSTIKKRIDDDETTRIEAAEIAPNETRIDRPTWAVIAARIGMAKSTLNALGFSMADQPAETTLFDFLETRQKASGRWSAKQAATVRRMLAELRANGNESTEKRPKAATVGDLETRIERAKTARIERVLDPKNEAASTPVSTVQNASRNAPNQTAETRFETNQKGPSISVQNAPFQAAEKSLFEPEKSTHTEAEKGPFRFDELAFINAALVFSGCLSMGLAMGFFGAFISLPMAAMVIWTIRHGGDLAKHGSYSLAFFTSVLIEIFFAGSHFQNIRTAVNAAEHLPFGRDVYAAALCFFTFLFSLFTLSIRRKAAIDDAFNPAA